MATRRIFDDIIPDRMTPGAQPISDDRMVCLGSVQPRCRNFHGQRAACLSVPLLPAISREEHESPAILVS